MDDRQRAWHPTDDDLVLQFYSEHPPARASQIKAHLAACTACFGAWTQLRETMTLVDAAPVPSPAADFEQQIWARVDARLSREAGVWSWRQAMPLAAMAASVALVIALTGVWQQPPPVAPAAIVDATRHERVLLAALDSHLAQAELLLTELLNTSSGTDLHLNVDFERSAADELVAAGRLYRVTAEETGDVRLVAMLEDLESVMVEVARSPDQVGRDDWESLRTWIGDEDLLFKVRAAANDVRVRQDNLITVSEGPL